MGSRGACRVLIGAALLAGCGGDDDGNAGITRESPEQQDAWAKSDARDLAAAVEVCFFREQDYSRCENPEGVEAPTAFVETARLSTYTVVAPSESGTSFRVEKTKAGALERTCTEPGEGGCPATGTW